MNVVSFECHVPGFNYLQKAALGGGMRNDNPRGRQREIPQMGLWRLGQPLFARHVSNGRTELVG